MSEPAEPQPTLALERYEPWTRRLARVGAAVLAVSMLLPRSMIHPEAGVQPLWFWESDPGFGQATLQPNVSAILVLLGLACLAWWAASTWPLARRGRWLTLPPAWCLAVLSAHESLGSDINGNAWPFGWSLVPVLVAGLGLTLLRTTEHRRLGRAMCALSGALLLGVLLLPIQPDVWPAWWESFNAPRSKGGGLHMKLSLLGWLVLGPSLLWVGRSRATSRSGLTLVTCLVVVAIGMGIVASTIAWHRLRGPRGVFEEDAILILDRLRMALRAWSPVLLLGTGLFSWVVGMREERPLEAVFE